MKSSETPYSVAFPYISVSLAFGVVFVYLKPHFDEGGYCAQSRRVPVPGSRLLIKPLGFKQGGRK